MSETFKTYKLNNSETIEQLIRDMPDYAREWERVLIVGEMHANLLNLHDRRVSQLVWDSVEMARANNLPSDRRRLEVKRIIEWVGENWAPICEIAQKDGGKSKSVDLKKRLDKFLAEKSPAIAEESSRKKKVGSLF